MSTSSLIEQVVFRRNVWSVGPVTKVSALVIKQCKFLSTYLWQFAMQKFGSLNFRNCGETSTKWNREKDDNKEEEEKGRKEDWEKKIQLKIVLHRRREWEI